MRGRKVFGTIDSMWDQLLQRACRVDIPYEIPVSSDFEVKHRAAVAVIFAQKNVLLIERAVTERNDIHAGQMAFPGGRVEAQDASDEDTAKRETFEEVGLVLSSPALGSLPGLFTFASFTQMTPVLFSIDGSANPSDLVLNTSEIAHAVWCPWDSLMQSFRMEWFERSGRRFQTPVFEVPPVSLNRPLPKIWGATAVVLKNLKDRLSRL